MANIVKDLGAVSAYALAVEHGFEGTEAEWAMLQMRAGENAQRAENAANASVNSAQRADAQAERAANSATAAHGAMNNAANSETNAKTYSEQAAGSADNAANSATAAGNSASAAAKSAAEAAETLESIPEDYHELSQIVGKLSEEMVHANVKINITTVDGKFVTGKVGSEGFAVSDAESAVTDFIRVEPGTLVRCKNVFLTGNRSICCYDYDGVFVSCPAMNTTATEVVVEIPQNAYLIRATSRAGEKPELEYASIVLEKAERNHSDVMHANVKLSTVITNGKFVSGRSGSEGSLVTDEESAATDFIAVVPKSKICARNVYLTGNRSVCCYDENKTFLAVLIVANAERVVNFIIPDNAYYIRVTSRRGQTPELEYTSLVLEEVEKIKASLSELNGEYDDLLRSMEGLARRQDNLTQEIADTNQRIDNLNLENVETVVKKLNAVSTADIASVAECIKQTEDIKHVANGDRIGVQKQCVITFLNDDGGDGQYHDLYPIMSELGVPYSQAIYTGQYNIHTIEMMENIIALGGDLGSHTVSHPHLMTLTESELVAELGDSKAWFTERGIPCEYIVYPNGESNDLVRMVAKRYYNFGVSTEDMHNAYPIEDFAIKRITLGAYAAEGKNTYEYYKAQVDIAITNKTWLVFMLHSNNSGFDAVQKQHLRDIVAYAKANGVPIMSMTNAYKIFGNAIKIGDNSTGTSGRGSNQPHFVLSKWGDFSTNIFSWSAPE